MVKVIRLVGTPYERGLHYGSRCREEIRISIRSYTAFFRHNKQLSWEQAKQLALGYVDAIREAGEDYLQELQGIADGAELELADILAINVRSELLYAPTTPEECTAFSLLPPATVNGTVLAGQNWDYISSQRKAIVCLRIPAHDGKPSLLLFVEAGMIGGKGMNSAGLGMTLNALHTPERGEGLPLHVRMRRILEQKTLEAAYAAAISGGQPVSANLILTHRDGVSLGVELDPAGIDVLQPVDGVLLHTNHFLGKLAGRTHADNANTYTRLQRIRYHLQGQTGLTAQDLKASLSDHADYPYSVCRHLDPNDPLEQALQITTNHVLIMDLTAGTAEFALGNPCEAQWTTLTLDAPEAQ